MPHPLTSESALLTAAKRGDEPAFERLVTSYRGQLHAHCYRMLGSVQDAEDALQETLLRAWRGLERFEGRSSIKSWLYTIATNTCLNQIQRRPKRILPLDHAPPADPTQTPGRPLVESVWIEPYPDEMLGLEEGRAGPEASYELRESVELAFVAALQHLPATQRAVLILREVLDFSAREVAQALETSVASVNSALQRSRKAIAERVPEQSQQQTMRQLGDEKMRAIVDQYMAAMDANDVSSVTSLLAADAAWSMPPLSSWYRGDDIPVWLANSPLSGAFSWRRRATTANGQPAIGAYVWNDGEQAFRAFALDVLTLRGDRIAEVTSFIARFIEGRDEETFRLWPHDDVNEAKVAATFERFGLPARLPA